MNNNPKIVRKAIIAAAGLGTRFLPQTKAMPKEMLPIIDKPVIQLIVEEAVAAGVTDIIIVTGSTKRAIEDHFDRAVELEDDLRAKGKEKEARQIKEIAELANFVYVRQKGETRGNALPVINSAHLLGDEPFFVFFADDFFRSDIPRAVQLIEAFKQTGKSVISAINVDIKDSDKYGMIKVGNRLNSDTMRVVELIEKPGPEYAPSNIASVGGYLLTPAILPLLSSVKVSKRGEIELSEAINQLAKRDEVYCKKITGAYHDTGNKQKYLEALIDTALNHKEIAKPLRKYLEKRLKEE
jgi:UTP--glucose-1-phosphate uridylyltransferase